jgi:hypothetical protein
MLMLTSADKMVLLYVLKRAQSKSKEKLSVCPSENAISKTSFKLFKPSFP